MNHTWTAWALLVASKKPCPTRLDLQHGYDRDLPECTFDSGLVATSTRTLLESATILLSAATVCATRV